jgi:ectoine hydroxylase-related dioxygenase (phytanoyl-CoA dioxygenase family)
MHKGADPSKYDVDIESMIDKSGCADVYYVLEECLGEHERDWTKCQKEVKALNACNRLQRERAGTQALTAGSAVGATASSSGSGSRNGDVAAAVAAARLAAVRTFPALAGAEEEVAAEVRAQGLAVVEGLLTPAEAQVWAAQAKALCERKALDKGICKEVGRGRFHASLLTGRSPEAKAARALMEKSIVPRLKPILTEFFGSLGQTHQGAKGSTASAAPYYLSEIQLVRTAPGCATQAFHVDNTTEGLTVMVALEEIPAVLGPTQVVRGSHDKVFSSDGNYVVRNAPFTLGPGSVEVLDLSLARCSAYCMDCRTLHRGTANAHPTDERFALILRWDQRGSRPPGMNPLSVLLVNAIGKFTVSWGKCPFSSSANLKESWSNFWK